MKLSRNDAEVLYATACFLVLFITFSFFTVECAERDLIQRTECMDKVNDADYCYGVHGRKINGFASKHNGKWYFSQESNAGTDVKATLVIKEVRP